MIHADDLKGGINHTYGGEIDALPTILHLLGIKDNNTVQFGNDLLSKKNVIKRLHLEMVIWFHLSILLLVVMYI